MLGDHADRDADDPARVRDPGRRAGVVLRLPAAHDATARDARRHRPGDAGTPPGRRRRRVKSRPRARHPAHRRLAVLRRDRPRARPSRRRARRRSVGAPRAADAERRQLHRRRRRRAARRVRQRAAPAGRDAVARAPARRRCAKCSSAAATCRRSAPEHAFDIEDDALRAIRAEIERSRSRNTAGLSSSGTRPPARKRARECNSKPLRERRRAEPREAPACASRHLLHAAHAHDGVAAVPRPPVARRRRNRRNSACARRSPPRRGRGCRCRSPGSAR